MAGFGDDTQMNMKVADLLKWVRKSYGPDAEKQARDYSGFTPEDDFKYRHTMFKLEVEELLAKYKLRFNHLVYMDGVWEGSDDLILEDLKYEPQSMNRKSPLWTYFEAEWQMKDAIKRYRDDV